MDSRSQFLLQLLQKLGSPLMAAVSAHSVDEEKDAQTLAALLSESVKISIALSQAMNLKTDDGDADAIRVSLAALAAGLVAESYRQHARVPGDTESRRISKALESVIVFADNFAPAAEHAQRLQTLNDTPPFFDPVQTNIYAIHALLPAIAAISEFSFGQGDTKLVQEVSDRLAAKAKELLNTLGGDASPMSELIILQALGKIYAGAHRAETERLNATGDTGTAAIDTVWKSFETQVSMVAVLIGSMTGIAISTGRGGSGAVKPATSPEPAEVAPPLAMAPPLAASRPPSSTPPATGGNPMSFFKKK
jgi:cytochrome c556